jgi:hypothetical protein
MRRRIALLGVPAIAALIAALAVSPAHAEERYDRTGVIEPASTVAATAVTGAFMAMQMNLCNSGYANCYKNGAAIPEAANAITAQHPDLVTLNEICSADVVTLAGSVAAVWPADYTFYVFMPAWDRSTNTAYKCRNGDQYGIGVVGHTRAADWSGLKTASGIYPQQSDSTEQRAWVCAYSIGNVVGCTTHLTNVSASIATQQCKQLMFTEVPNARSAWGFSGPTLVAGDLNLKYGGTNSAQNCVPSGYYRKGDGDVQHTIASNHFAFLGTAKVDLRQTDHDAWIVRMSL